MSAQTKAGAEDAAARHYSGGVVDDIMVVGVGGQGVIVAAAVIADTAMLHGGLEVKLSETRGMSQRGGSVSSHIRIGETVTAPSISPGEVDYLLAFESAEGLRAAPSVVPGGVAIVNTQQIVPPLASQGDMSYPFDAAERMARGDRRVIVVDGNGIALEVGDLKVAGIVLVGALSTHLPFDVETWRAAIVRNVPPKWKDLNFAAFAAGREVGGIVREYFDPINETLEPEDLQDLQLGRLQTVVAHSYAGSDAYRALCDAAGVAPADIKSLDDLRRLPFIDKLTLRDYYPDKLRTCGLDNIIEVHSTSGTTGKPTPIWASRHDMDLWFERNARTMWMIGLRPGDLLQNMFGYGLPTSIGLQYGAQHAGIGVVPAGIGRQELLIDLMVDLGVTAICTTPSYGLYLAEKALERGVDLSKDTKLRIGLFGAEPWPETGRERLAAAMGVDVFNEYGMGEFLGPGMAAECPVKQGMHVWSDHIYVECIDPVTLEPVADGAPGELVWTSLTSDSTAMIRYRSHDISSLTYEPCACGRSHPRIGRITGRSDDAVSVGGLVVFPSQIEEVLLKYDEFGSNFCMVIDNLNNLDRLTLQVEVRGLGEMSDDAQAKLSKGIVTGVKTSVGVTPKIELHAPYALPRDTSGQGKTACHRVDDRRAS